VTNETVAPLYLDRTVAALKQAARKDLVVETVGASGWGGVQRPGEGKGRCYSDRGQRYSDSDSDSDSEVVRECHRATVLPCYSATVLQCYSGTEHGNGEREIEGETPPMLCSFSVSPLCIAFRRP